MRNSVKSSIAGVLLLGLGMAAGCGGGSSDASLKNPQTSSGGVTGGSTGTGTSTGTSTSTSSGSSTGGLTIGGGGSGSTGGSTTGGPSQPFLRVTGWDAAKVLPIQTQPGQATTWFFVESGAFTVTNLELLENGAPVVAQAQQIGSAGHLFIVQTPAQGVNVTVRGQASGVQITSNVCTVQTGAFAAGNTGGGGFMAFSPTMQSTAPQATPFSWGTAGTVTTYLLCALMLDQSTGQVGVALAVELPAGASSYTAGSGVSLTAKYVDGLLPPLTSPTTQTYAWHVVPLDATGWGVGTTVDIANYTAPAAASANNPNTAFMSIFTSILSMMAGGQNVNPTAIFMQVFQLMLNQILAGSGSSNPNASPDSWPFFETQ
jgi:hypothetical protein